MAERKMFMGIGASVARLQSAKPGTPSESTTRCLIAPNLSAEHPLDYDREDNLVPVDLAFEAGVCAWDKIEHDGWGIRTDGGDMSPGSSIHHGVAVTSIGYMSWPMYSDNKDRSAFVGALFLLTHQFVKYRDRIETHGNTWPWTRYRAAELTSVRYPDGRRYIGFTGTLKHVTENIAKVTIYRAGLLEEAGTWYLNLDDPDQVDNTIEPGDLNKGIEGGGLPTLGRKASSEPGYIFLNLKLAAQLWDRSDFGLSYGLTGPKLPYWLEG